MAERFKLVNTSRFKLINAKEEAPPMESLTPEQELAPPTDESIQQFREASLTSQEAPAFPTREVAPTISAPTSILERGKSISQYAEKISPGAGKAISNWWARTALGRLPTPEIPESMPEQMAMGMTSGLKPVGSRIAGPAIKMKSGDIVTGKDFKINAKTHADLWEKMGPTERKAVADPQGFVTDTGEYLSRKEAAQALTNKTPAEAKRGSETFDADELINRPIRKSIIMEPIGLDDSGGSMVTISPSVKEPGKIQGTYFVKSIKGAEWEPRTDVQFDNIQEATDWMNDAKKRADEWRPKWKEVQDKNRRLFPKPPESKPYDPYQVELGGQIAKLKANVPLDSMVRDDAGIPLKMYHASAEPVKWKEGQTTKFFSRPLTEEFGDNVTEAYLDIRKPAPNLHEWMTNRDKYDGMFMKAVDYEGKPGYSAVVKSPKQIIEINKKEAGKVSMDALSHITFSTAGAVTGAAIDDENRWRGAIIGGVTGFTISKGMLSKVLGKKPATRFVEKPTVAEEAKAKETINVPSLTEEMLRRPTVAKIDKAAPDIFEAAGSKLKPTKDIPYNVQLVDAASKLTPEVRMSILKKHNITEEELVAELFGMKRETVRKAAEVMAYSSQAVQKIARMSPEAARALDDLRRAAGDISPSDIGLSWWRWADNIRRGMLVTQLATGMRNAESQGLRVGLDVFETALESGLQMVFKGGRKVDPLDGMEMFLNLFRRNKADVEHILKNTPKEYDRLFGRYMSDIVGWQKGTEKIKGGVEKAVDILNTPNRFQEFLVRRAVFMGKLDQALKNRGQDLGDIIKSNKTGSINHDDIRYAVNQALDYTFAKAPVWGSVGHAFVSAVNKIPGATFIVPFPRFMINSLRFTWNYNPTGFLNLLSPTERALIGTPKIMARALIGSAMLGAAYQLRNSEYAGEKWYEVNINGRPVDTRAYNPFASYLFLADVMKKSKDGTLDAFTSKDIAMGVLSTNLRAGAGLYVLDKAIEGIASTFSSGDQKKIDKGLTALKEFGGETASGFFMPAVTVRDFLYGFDDYLIKNKREEPFLGPIKEKIPGLESTLPPVYSPTREEPLKRPMPGFRQATGFMVGPPKNQFEKELDKLGFERREVLPSTGNQKADQLVAKYMGLLSEKIAVPITESKEYQSLDRDFKGLMLKEVIGEVRKSAREAAEGENPELFVNLKLEGMPKRQRFIFKEAR